MKNIIFKNLKYIIASVFIVIFIVSSLTITTAICNVYRISPILIIIIILGLLSREAIIYGFNRTLKRIFPTNHLPIKIKQPLDKLYSWCIIVFQLGLGINIFQMLLELKPITTFKYNNSILAISVCLMIIYVLGVFLGTAYIHYKEKYEKEIM